MVKSFLQVFMVPSERNTSYWCPFCNLLSLHNAWKDWAVGSQLWPLLKCSSLLRVCDCIDKFHRGNGEGREVGEQGACRSLYEQKFNYGTVTDTVNFIKLLLDLYWSQLDSEFIVSLKESFRLERTSGSQSSTTNLTLLSSLLNHTVLSASLLTHPETFFHDWQDTNSQGDF